MAQQVGEPFKRIDIDTAKQMIAEGDVQIVDVRQPDEYAQGHVPGAMLIPLNTVMARIDQISADKDVILVCGVGERSAVAAEMAAAMGRTRLYNLEGGTTAWVKQGNPVER